MIERQMQELKDEMTALRELLESVQRDLAYYRDGDPAPEAEPQPEQKAEPAPEPKSEPEEVTREDLSKKCINLIRENKAEQKQLLDLLAEYNAKTVKQVTDDKLAEVYARLKEFG